MIYFDNAATTRFKPNGVIKALVKEVKNSSNSGRSGHDDAIAIVLALASPELDVKAITSSAGNQTPEKTLRNVLRMLTLLNRTDIPVAGGAVKPLMRELIIADNVHGESGLLQSHLLPLAHQNLLERCDVTLNCAG